MQIVKAIQQQLETIYDIKTGAAATDYIIDPSQLGQLLPHTADHHDSRELFLVNPTPDEDSVEIALYLAPDLLENLETHQPSKGLSTHNIGDLCTAIEGVSHFVCYLFRANRDESTTQLELELQAEIDKFVLLSFNIFNQNTTTNRLFHTDLIDLLFENYTLHHDLNHVQRERYVTANDLARKFCYELSQSLKFGNVAETLQFIRSFYPLSQQDKIRWIVQ